MSIADHAREAADLDALASAARGFGIGAGQTPAGLPDATALTKLANELFAAVPGQSAPIPAGPSLAGFGASPADVAGSSAPHLAAAATSPVPTSQSPAHVAGPQTPTPFDSSALDERVLLGQGLGQQLDRDATTQPDVVSQEDLGRRSGSERGDESISTADDTTDLVGQA